MTIEPQDVCFVGLGSSAPFYYRCLLPGHALGADYAGFHGEPPNASLITGIVRGGTRKPDLTSYKVVIVQQARGLGWLKAITELQSRGIVVLYEIDDFLHGIAAQKDLDYRDGFLDLGPFEINMQQADGLIVSTPYLERQYRKFNKRVWVCENAIDPARYAYSKPERETVNIGWAGATGHRDAALPWLQAVAWVMERMPNTTFVSIGQAFAEGFVEKFGRERALSIPWCAIEQYPAAMTMFDIAIAPAANRGFYLGKSDLRWLEAAALGIPTIGHPQVYRHIQHGVTGFHASDPGAIVQALTKLITDADLRTRVGEAARQVVLESRAFPEAAFQWRWAIDQAVEATARRRTLVA